MKTSRLAILARGLKCSVISLAFVLAAAGSSLAATTGFNQAGAGPWDYNDGENWVSGAINGTWDTSLTNTAAQTVTFAVDTVLTTGLTFNYAGNYALTLDAAAAGTKTITLAADVGLNTGGGTSANVTIGNASNHLNVDLGGVTRTLTVAASRTLTFTDVVSNGGIIKAGTGTLTLSAANTYTSGTTISAGTLVAGNNSALGTAGTITMGDANSGANTITLSIGDKTISRPITVANYGGTVTLGTSGTFSGAITLNRDVTLSGATFSGGISGAGTVTTVGNVIFSTSTNNFNGNVNIGASSYLQLGNGTKANYIPDNAIMTVAAAGRLGLYEGGNNEIIGCLNGGGSGVIAYSSDTLTVGSGDNSGSFSGAIVEQSATLALVKIGTGTQTLSGVNTYHGTTTITNGILKISAGSLGNTAISCTGAGVFAVQPGSATTINLGTTVAGTAGATLNLGGQTFDMADGFISTCNLQQQASFATAGLTVATGATFKFNIGSSGADKLAVTKSASVAGTVNITIDTTGASSLTQGATYDLITAASGLTTGSPTWQFTGGGTSQSVTIGGLPYTLTLVSTDTAIRVRVGSPTPHLAITLVSPVSPAAGVGFDVTVQVLDTSDTPINVTGATEVTLTRRLGSGILAGVTNATIALGTSSKTISGVTYTKAESGVALTVTRVSGDDLTSGDSAVFTVAPGSANKLAFGQQPGNTAPGAAISPAVTALVQDANGNTVTNDTRSVTITASGTTLDGTLTMNAVAGVATFSNIKPTTKGNGVTLKANDGSLTEATSSAFNVDTPVQSFIPPGNTTTTVGAGQEYIIGTGQSFQVGMWQTQAAILNQTGGSITVTGSWGNFSIGSSDGPTWGEYNMSGNATFSATNLNGASGAYTFTITGYLGKSKLTMTDTATANIGSLTLKPYSGAAAKVVLSGSASLTVGVIGNAADGYGIGAGCYIDFVAKSLAKLTITGTHDFTTLVTDGKIRIDGALADISQFVVVGNTLSLKQPPQGTLIQFF